MPFPAYFNDLAAVRLHLDTKNDNKTLNASSIFVIGANEAATLGMAWLAGEWKAQAIYPTDNELGRDTSATSMYHKIFVGEISPKREPTTLGPFGLVRARPTSISEFNLKQWVSD